MITATFIVGDYNDYNDVQQGAMDENKKINLFDLYRAYLQNNKENRRNTDDEAESWTGRIGDPTPPPKVYPHSEQRYHESVPESWTGRWMPDRIGDPTPSPKVYPHSEQGYHESMLESHHAMYMGQISSDCDDAKVNIVTSYTNSLLKGY